MELSCDAPSKDKTRHKPQKVAQHCPCNQTFGIVAVDAGECFHLQISGISGLKLGKSADGVVKYLVKFGSLLFRHTEAKLNHHCLPTLVPITSICRPISLIPGQQKCRIRVTRLPSTQRPISHVAIIATRHQCELCVISVVDQFQEAWRYSGDFDASRGESLLLDLFGRGGLGQERDRRAAGKAGRSDSCCLL
jgi:hypothetical protein